MLTKNDLEQIDGLMQKRMKESFQEFYEHFFEPHVSQSIRQHEEIVKEIISLKHEVKGIKDEVGEVKEFIRDHDKRITTLESLPFVKN